LNDDHFPLREVIPLADCDCGQMADYPKPKGNADAGHDPVAVGHLLWLLHRPKSLIEHHALRLPLSRSLIQHVAAPVSA
jgi:hypothetical protein